MSSDGLSENLYVKTFGITKMKQKKTQVGQQKKTQRIPRLIVAQPTLADQIAKMCNKFDRMGLSIESYVNSESLMEEVQKYQSGLKRYMCLEGLPISKLEWKENNDKVPS